MALLGDRIQETTTTAGTGTFTLGGAVTGYVTFNSVFTNGDIVWYVIDDGAGNWEIGTGTLGTGTLTRNVFQSSNANALVPFAAGNKRIFCSAPYTYLLPDQTGQTTGSFLTSNGSIGSWGSLSSPPAIGNTTPNTGAFTTVTTTGGVQSRVVATASSATITPTADTADLYEVTALATPATIAAPSGTPTDGQKLIIRFKDNGTAQALSWTTTAGAYRAVGVTLPTTTVISKVLYVGCIYNTQDTFWDVIAVAQQ